MDEFKNVNVKGYIGICDPCRLLTGQRRTWKKSGLTGIRTSDKLQSVVVWNLLVCGFSFFNRFQNLFLKRNSWSYFASTKEPSECVSTSACYIHWTFSFLVGCFRKEGFICIIMMWSCGLCGCGLFSTYYHDPMLSCCLRNILIFSSSSVNTISKNIATRENDYRTVCQNVSHCQKQSY